MKRRFLSVGETFGHWTIIRDLGLRPRRGGGSERWFEVRSACRKLTKAVPQTGVAYEKSTTCVKCTDWKGCGKSANPVTNRPAGVTPACRRPGKLVDRPLHRCEVVVSTGPRHTYVCSALHSPKDFREHLADQHRIETDNPAAAFGPALNLNGGE